MSLSIDCKTHGHQAAAAACAHILDASQDETPRGFCWAIGEDGGFQALCSQCEGMDAAAWSRVRDEVHVMLCFKCFQRAAALNNVKLPVR